MSDSTTSTGIGEEDHLAYAIRLLSPLRAKVDNPRVGEREPRQSRKSWRSVHSSLLFLSPRDSSLLLPPLITFPFLAVVSSSFSRSSRVSLARWCYFRASVLCKCRTLALRCRFRCRAHLIGQVIISRFIHRGYHHLTPSNLPCAPDMYILL